MGEVLWADRREHLWLRADLLVGLLVVGLQAGLLADHQLVAPLLVLLGDLWVGLLVVVLLAGLLAGLLHLEVLPVVVLLVHRDLLVDQWVEDLLEAVADLLVGLQVLLLLMGDLLEVAHVEVHLMVLLVALLALLPAVVLRVVLEEVLLVERLGAALGVGVHEVVSSFIYYL